MAEELTKEHLAKPDSNSRSLDPTGGVAFGPPQKPNDLGSLGPYRVIRAIGRGGMGMVFLGVDPKLRRKVALKVMLPKFLARPTARERFLREARALAAVKNDHVVTIYQVDEANGVPYLALDYLLGSMLEDFLRAGAPLSMSQLVHVAREVALGLAAAHEHGVIHRDVKPENIWLEAPDGRVKLIDFGLARLPSQGTGTTQDGTVLGTPAYMSPEQARGQEIDARSDLFSLGGVIYRLVSGRVPFTGDTPFAMVLSLTHDAHQPLIDVNPKVPEALSHLVDRLLAKDVEKRPASAREVAKELKRIEAQVRYPDQVHTGEGSTSKPLQVTAIPIADNNDAWTGLETLAPLATPSNSSRIAAPPERPVWPWIAGGVAVIIAAIVVGFTAFGGKKSAQPLIEAESVPSRRNSPKTVSPPKPPVDPWTVLFNGQDLSGWVPGKDGSLAHWKAHDGVLSAGEAGELLLSEGHYGNCELRLEYRWASGGDAGVILFLGNGGPGVEIKIADDSNVPAFRPIFNPSKFPHGSFNNLQKPYASNAKKIGEWNSLKITNRNGKVTVEENGQSVNDRDFTQFIEKAKQREKYPGLFDGRGQIALQIRYGTIEFRNIRIKE